MKYATRASKDKRLLFTSNSKPCITKSMLPFCTAIYLFDCVVSSI